MDSEFRLGAEKSLRIAEKEQPDCIILQSRSPSCGVKLIYDGTFTGKLVSGQGIFAGMAQKAGFHVVDIEDIVKEGMITP